MAARHQPAASGGAARSRRWAKQGKAQPAASSSERARPAATGALAGSAAALALKNLAVTSVLAATTWRDIPGLARAYLLDVAVPLGLMAFGAEAGRLLAAAALPVGAPLPVAAGLALSLLLAAGCALPCFAQRLLRAAPPLVAG